MKSEYKIATKEAKIIILEHENADLKAKLAKARQETLREVRTLIKDNCWQYHDRDLDCRCDEIVEKMEAEQ